MACATCPKCHISGNRGNCPKCKGPMMLDEMYVSDTPFPMSSGIWKESMGTADDLVKSKSVIEELIKKWKNPKA